MFSNKSILIPGGSGQFGRCFIKTILRDYPQVDRIIVYSRDVQKHAAFQALYPEQQYPQLRFFIGDIRDKERLLRVCERVDIIIHAVNLASIEGSEYSSNECMKTNIFGAENVIDAALKSGVQDVVALSSDKACSPLNLFGATQLVSDKLFVAANNLNGKRNILFSVVRYGNVIGSNGTVVPFFLQRRELGGRKLPITDKRMIRFMISNQDVVSAVEFALANHIGGEIFVPKISSFKITDLATAISPEMEQEEIGKRPDEKIHEELITIDDSENTIEIDNYYVIHPSITFNGNRSRVDYLTHYGAKSVQEDFHYPSKDNPCFENVSSLREKIQIYLILHINYKFLHLC